MTPPLPGTTPEGATPQPQQAGTRFRAHGRTEVWAEGAFVHVVAAGPFNVEAVDEFSLKMTALYRELPRDLRFVNLSEMRDSIMATPEAWERFAEHLQRVNDSGLPLVGTAWIVAPEVEGRALFLPRAEALFRRHGRVFATFEGMAAAEAWAREKIAY
jgi:hypothetical protein